MFLSRTIPTDLFIDQFFGSYSSSYLIPPIDIAESETDYELAVNAAGFSKDDFKINVEKNVLEISGERKKSEKKYNVKESVSGKFTRKYTLPDEVNVDEITAEYVDGILTIKLPKDKAKVKNRVIQVK